MASRDRPELARERAEARFKMQEQRAEDARRVLLEADAERAAVAAKTARLRALRLAKEDADRAAAAAAKPAKRTR